MKSLKIASINSKRNSSEKVVVTQVELVARLSNGTEVVIPRGSYINIDNPRELPTKLLQAGRITEKVAEEMSERASKLPDFVKMELTFRPKAN